MPKFFRRYFFVICEVYYTTKWSPCVWLNAI